MKRLTKMTVITLVGAGALAFAAAPGLASGAPEGPVGAGPTHGFQDMMVMTSGVMGQPMMNFGMMGPGMMGPGMMGPGMMGFAMLPTLGADLNLSVNDVRGQLDQSLTWHGNKRIKVGAVTEVDDNTIVADVVTQDGSLVQRFEVNRHTGRMWQAQ